MSKAKVFKFNRCIHWEKGSKGRYIGLQNPLFDIYTLIFPLSRNDGYRGFFEWFIFRFGWYPVGVKRTNEVTAQERKMMASGG